MLQYLNPKLSGAPSYLQLISDPNDPPPHAVHSKSRRSSHNSHHASLNSRHNSQSSQSYYRKHRTESQSSRHSSASTDIYSSPVGSNLNLDLPPSSNGQNSEYEHIQPVELVGGKYAPYMMTSPSIPENDDDAFPEGYDYVDYSHRKLPKSAAYSVIRGTLQCLRNGYSEPGYDPMDIISNNNLNLLNNNLPSMHRAVDNIPGGRTQGQAYPVDNAMFDFNDLIQASLVWVLIIHTVYINAYMCVCVCVLSTMYQTQWVVEGQLLCMRFVSVIIFKYSENIWRLCNFYCSFHSPLCEQFL